MNCARIILLAIAGNVSSITLSPGGPYKTSGGPREGMINIHIVPHTHDDVGWLKTIDELYLGAKNDVQISAARFILDSVMESLAENKDRKFIYVELAFFSRWWRRQNDLKRAQVQGFIKSGQLEFINGGWASNDEATPTYLDIVDQHTMGGVFIAHEFGSDHIPTVGWQVDPFGHSLFQAKAYNKMGMNSWFFSRSDQQDFEIRKMTRRLEDVHSSILVGSMDGYGPPSGFDWNVFSADEPLNDDIYLGAPNIERRLNDFVAACTEQAKRYNHPNETTQHIMLTMGSDFHYEYANTWFKNLDVLIHYANLDGRLNLFYSSPTMYTTSRAAQKRQWKDQSNYDWFPYCDSTHTQADESGNIISADGHAYWTGYFTSRPILKRIVREASTMLEACRTSQIITTSPDKKSEPINDPVWMLWEALSVVQHHDGVSGTSKERVAWDYYDRLKKGMLGCRQLIANATGETKSAGEKIFYRSLLDSDKDRILPREPELEEVDPSDLPVTFKFAYYESSLGNTESRPNQASGAYIFRPECPEGPVAACRPKSVGEVDWIKVKTYVDTIEWEVGPIPQDSGLVGKEIVLLIEAKNRVNNNNVFFTDSNGFEWVRRELNKRTTWDYQVTDPVSGNYYPVTSGITIMDEKSALTVTPDRSVGGTSLVENQIEVMIHRRTFKDDDRGVAEPLDERTREDPSGPITVKGKTYFDYRNDIKGPFETPPFSVPWHQQRPLVELGNISDISKANEVLTIWNLNGVIVPTHIHRVDVPEFCKLTKNRDCILVRLGVRGTQQGSIDLERALVKRRTVKVTETVLHGGRRIADAAKLKINWVVSPLEPQEGDIGMVVNIRPGDLRTFILEVEMIQNEDAIISYETV